MKKTLKFPIVDNKWYLVDCWWPYSELVWYIQRYREKDIGDIFKYVYFM